MKRFIAAIICLALVIIPFAPAAAAAPSGPSDALVNFIKSQEGFVDHVYYVGGYAYIGYGQMVNPSDWPNGITEAQATELMRGTLQTIAGVVDRYAENWATKMDQGMYDAVLSLCYNLGTQWLTKNGRLVTALKEGTPLSPVQAADLFGGYCHAGGINTHLIRRRLYEAGMFSYGDYTGAHNGDYTWLILKTNGGTADNDNDIAFFLKGRPYGTLPGAFKSGAYFAGWSTGSGILAPSDIAGEPITVTATWSSTPVVLPDPLPPEPTPEIKKSRYSDVPADAWYIDFVEALSDDGVINGYTDGRFGPRDPVTFGQALKLVILAVGLPEQPTLGAHWADGYLAYAIEHELFEGEAQSLDAPASRLLVAHLAANELGLEPESEAAFSDCDDPLAAALAGTGVITGIANGDGTFRYEPGASIDRSQASALIFRLREYADGR